MVIKQAPKTRAAQRKGALTNWKKTGRVIIKYLRLVNVQNRYCCRKRDISGDDLRREFWVHEEASTPKKKKKEGRGYDIKLDQPKVCWGQLRCHVFRSLERLQQLLLLLKLKWMPLILLLLQLLLMLQKKLI